MPKITQKFASRCNSATVTPCPVCGAAVTADPPVCRHCKFRLTPEEPEADPGKKANPPPAPAAPAALENIRADLRLGPDKSIVNACNIPASALAKDLNTPLFDVICADAALDTAPDVNQCLSGLAAHLKPGGLLILISSGPRFGKNSRQILLERYGFRLAGRPWKWRLADLFGQKRWLARKIQVAA